MSTNNTKTEILSKRINSIQKEIDGLERRKQTLENEKKTVINSDKVYQYLNTYFGKELLKRHSLDEVGVWVVRGESPNCDFGGSHYQPIIGYYEGRLSDVIERAANDKDFWSWGAGGDIHKIEIVALPSK